eukprot:CAMPEP_0176072748 /NCGR_PEP_ID=MMETSP0120_2-20121206/36346_1 /TAXON_ID=160619 /ORGANISM="Kryptoperidinium foliaceum, Strain CCMP 1326" /LENGTH=425 /DNA_ID=CAMNT_0017406425 /DNA_START=142 /DNA_END=1415 /DNA_ORIENTATION=-
MNSKLALSLLLVLFIENGCGFHTAGSFSSVKRSQRVGVRGLSFQPAPRSVWNSEGSSVALQAYRMPFGTDDDSSQRPSLRNTSLVFSNVVRRLRRWTKRAFFAAALFLVVNLSTMNPANARSGVRSGGRIGGSFGAPTRAPITRSLPRSSSLPRSYHYRTQPRMIIHRSPHVHVHAPAPYIDGDTAVMTRYAAPPRRLRMSDVVLVTGVGTLVTINVMDKIRKEGGGRMGIESPLGPGVSVLSVTVAVNVPDRDSPNSLLDRLSRLALTAQTDTRKGVQDLTTEAALELLRQRDSIVSVDSQYSHFSRISDAQRAFNTLSIGGRSMYDEETLSNYGGSKKFDPTPYAKIDSYPRATVAVVTLNLCIEGDSTKATKIKNRVELQSLLSRIASDSQVEDCLLSAEVLWSPESRMERITSEDVYADYP